MPPSAARTPDAPDLAARFRDALERLTGGPPGPENRLGLAVSGGPDSLALLLLAHHAYPGSIAAATVDHGLRRESGSEALIVADYCRDLGIPHQVLTPGEPISGNLQSAARAVRYALLAEWSEGERLGWVATAHHADDQLETMLMRLLRGSGVDGLAAIRPVNGNIVRPLLGMRKAELETLVAAHGLEPVRDPSNADPRFDRARLRRLLAALPDLEPERASRSAEALAAASEALRWLAEREAGYVVVSDAPGILLTDTGYPHDFLRRLTIICIGRIDSDAAPHGPALDALIDALQAGEKRTIGDVLAEPLVRDGKPAWRFSPAPPRKTG